jgi:Alginate export
MLAKLVAIEHGVFDDGHEPGQTFGGFGFIRSPRSRPDSGISGYYLRLRREIAPFDQGVAREVRHTVGARTWGRRAPTDYNYEVIFQWGSFGDAPIRAWALATDTGMSSGHPRGPCGSRFVRLSRPAIDGRTVRPFKRSIRCFQELPTLGVRGSSVLRIRST